MSNMNGTGVVLSKDEQLISYCRKRGFCVRCYNVKTHKKKGNTLDALTTRNDKGEYLVYRGFCLAKGCYTLREAQLVLGELSSSPNSPDKRMPFRMDNHRGNDFNRGLCDSCGQIQTHAKIVRSGVTRWEPLTRRTADGSSYIVYNGKCAMCRKREIPGLDTAATLKPAPTTPTKTAPGALTSRRFNES